MKIPTKELWIAGFRNLTRYHKDKAQEVALAWWARALNVHVDLLPEDVRATITVMGDEELTKAAWTGCKLCLPWIKLKKDQKKFIRAAKKVEQILNDEPGGHPWIGYVTSRFSERIEKEKKKTARKARKFWHNQTPLQAAARVLAASREGEGHRASRASSRDAVSTGERRRAAQEDRVEDDT